MSKKYPHHIAIIMDGNGRWATAQRRSRLAGHQAGIKSVREMTKVCQELNVEVLSLFAFSSENWARPKTEVNALMKLFAQTMRKEVAELHRQNVRLRFIGSRARLGKNLLELMDSSVAITAENTGMTLVIAIDYGGRWDVTQACKSLVNKVSSGTICENEITEESLQAEMALATFPEPDLFIRTSGEQRLSNFFLWQLAYTELYFTDCYWPEFRRPQLMEAIAWYQSRERRFGVTSEQKRQQVCSGND